MADFHNRLQSWRQIAGLSEQGPARRSTSETDDIFAEQLEQLHRLCLQSLKARDDFYAALKAYIVQRERSPDHQVQVEDEAAFIQESFSQGSAYFLRRAIDRLFDTTETRHR